MMLLSAIIHIDYLIILCLQFISKGTITHITSNLTLSGIKKRYGPRVEDRFIEMFNIIELGGDSRRHKFYKSS